MSECRSLTNFIGNAFATIVVARRENRLDRDELNNTLNGELPDLTAPTTKSVAVSN